MDYSRIILSNKEAQQRWQGLQVPLQQKFISCHLAAFDCDGVMTDNYALVNADGIEYVRFSRGDFFGKRELEALGISFLIVSTEVNQVTTARGQKLGIPVRQGLADKALVLREWAKANVIPLENILYVGNDLNDWECLEMVGLPIAVADSYSPVRDLVLLRGGYIASNAGGHGAVREVLELLLHAKQPQIQQQQN